MLDQATRLRELVEARERGETIPANDATPDSRNDRSRIAPRVIAIASGKGGVGKSHVAANLAYCISRAGRKTLLVDADLGMANLDLLLGLTPGRNLGHVVTGQVDLGATLMEGPGGMLFLPGASGLARAADLSENERGRLMDQLFCLEESAELIIIDTGAGISRNVIAFASAADDVLVVTTPEPTAMTDAYALIKVLHGTGYDGRIGVVVNQAVDRAEGRGVYTRLAKTTARFIGRTIYDLGFLPADPQVGLAARNRRPVVACQPAAKVSRAMVELAARLLADGQALHRAHAQPGIFRRIAGLFF
ncbi:MAG: MinD/ParA family protein [Phycisphaerae bacterium]|nr:MinD/ParA family protein [Phycisphaerae bacterium]